MFDILAYIFQVHLQKAASQRIVVNNRFRS